jgi:hypothetical protein
MLIKFSIAYLQRPKASGPSITMGLTSFLLLLPFLISFLGQTGTEAAATYLYHVCPNTTTFTANSTYQSILNSLLASLTSNATSSTGSTTPPCRPGTPSTRSTASSSAGVISRPTPAETALQTQPKTWSIAAPMRKWPSLGTTSACYATQISISSPEWSPTLTLSCRTHRIYRSKTSLTCW